MEISIFLPMASEKIDVSVVLPCYNEGGYLERAVREITEVLSISNLAYEIIIAEDASTDNTAQVVMGLQKRLPNIIWLHRDFRGGRGSAVSNAFREARGDVCGFIDTDLETSAHYILPLVIAVRSGYDVASAYRIMSPTWRDFIHLPKTASTHVYRIIARILLKTDLRDTEVGCKFFKREKILPVLEVVKNKHWFWDTEIMVRPYYEGYLIKEIPTLFIRNWSHESKQALIKDSIEHLWHLFRFRQEIKRIYDFQRRA